MQYRYLIGADSFLVYPVDALGTNHIYMLYPPQHSASRHLLTVVATEDDTSLQVTFPNQFTGYIYYNGGDYAQGL